MEALRTESGWIVCGNCGHKLARLKDISTAQETSQKESITALKIEFKCTSCKAINILEVKNDKR